MRQVRLQIDEEDVVVAAGCLVSSPSLATTIWRKREKLHLGFLKISNQLGREGPPASPPPLAGRPPLLCRICLSLLRLLL
jgi:hypothetical protein